MRRTLPPIPDAPANQGTRNDWGTLKTLLPYLWAYKWRMSLALIFLVGAKMANVGVPLVLKKIIDSLTATASQPQAIVALPLAESRKERRVDPKGEAVRFAKSLGISFGDQDTP